MAGARTAIERFAAHARATNQIFLLAAKACALVLCRMEGGASFEAAMEPFPGPCWWEAVHSPEPAAAKQSFEETLRALLGQSWLLLCAVLAAHAPPGCPLFADPNAYSRIVGTFERRNCSVAVASPVEAYFLQVDAMPPGEEKAAVQRASLPVLEALGGLYRTPCEGTGLFPLQAMLNHSCEPNVTLLKSGRQDESDGRIVATLARDVAQGEELTNSYIDLTLALEARQRELLEYGFTCRCPKCLREEAQAQAPPVTAAPTPPTLPVVPPSSSAPRSRRRLK